MNEGIYKDKSLKKLLLHLIQEIIYQSYLEGSITKDLNAESVDISIKIAKKRLTKKESLVLFTEIHLDTIEKEALILFKKEMYELSIGLYSIWLEHWINNLIKAKCTMKKLPSKEIEDIIKNTNNFSKYSWLLSLLDLPPISAKHLNIINELIEKRNSFIHYKYKYVEENELFNNDEKYKLLCLKMPILTKYLKCYFSKNIISLKTIKNIIRRHPTIKKSLIDNN